jgi:hypothetical protein
VNWRELEAELCNIAEEGGYVVSEYKGDKVAAPSRDRRANLSELAQELHKRGWRKRNA